MPLSHYQSLRWYLKYVDFILLAKELDTLKRGALGMTLNSIL